MNNCGPLPKEWIDRWQPESPVQLPTEWDDMKIYIHPIPRKTEITEKNEQT